MIKNLAKKIIDTAFVPRCLACYAEVEKHGSICANCWKNIKFISDPKCEICSFPFEFEIYGIKICANCQSQKPSFTKAYSVFIYDEYSKKLITEFKYNDQTYKAKYLANIMCNLGKEVIAEADVITPVPLHFKKLIARKYNQSALLANIIAKTKRKKISYSLLRIKDTEAQASLRKSARQKNVKGAFAVKNKKDFLAKNVLLVDDVMTTGATAEECTKTLLKAGARNVFVLTLGRIFI